MDRTGGITRAFFIQRTPLFKPNWNIIYLVEHSLIRMNSSPPSLYSRELMLTLLQELDSAVFAENGFRRIVSLTSSALIPFRFRPWNSDSLAKSCIEVKLVS